MVNLNLALLMCHHVPVFIGQKPLYFISPVESGVLYDPASLTPVCHSGWDKVVGNLFSHLWYIFNNNIIYT